MSVTQSIQPYLPFPDWDKLPWQYDERPLTVTRRFLASQAHEYSTDYAWRWLGKLLTFGYNNTLAKHSTAFVSVKVTKRKRGTVITFRCLGDDYRPMVAFWDFTATDRGINDLRNALLNQELKWRPSKY